MEVNPDFRTTESFKSEITKKIKEIKNLYQKQIILLKDDIWDDVFTESINGDITYVNVNALIRKISNEPQKVSLEDFEYIEKLLEENK